MLIAELVAFRSLGLAGIGVESGTRSHSACCGAFAGVAGEEVAGEDLSAAFGLGKGADGFSAAIILLTALFADRPSVWRDSFQKIEVDYKISDKGLMLDQSYLREKLAQEYRIDVREITINRVFKNEVRLTLMYRDVPELRETIHSKVKEKPPKKDPFFY